MKKQRIYLRLTLVISILFGIILPLTLGVKDTTLIAISFSFIWFIYAVALFTITFLIEGRRTEKKLEAKEKSDSFPLHDIQELQALYEITIKKKNWNRNKRLWS